MLHLDFLSIPNDMTHFRKRLDDTGVVFFRNAPMNRATFLDVCKQFGEISMEGSTVDGLSQISFDVTHAGRTGGKGYSRAALFPHTDRSGMPYPPKILVNAVMKRAAAGGASTLVSGDKLVSVLGADYSNLLEVLCRKDVAVFRRADSVQMAPIIDRDDPKKIKIRFRYDDGLYISKFLEPYLPVLLQVIESIMEESSFDDGEGYIIDNHRVLHGRSAFSGHREAWRVLIK